MIDLPPAGTLVSREWQHDQFKQYAYVKAGRRVGVVTPEGYFLWWRKFKIRYSALKFESWPANRTRGPREGPITDAWEAYEGYCISHGIQRVEVLPTSRNKG